MKYIYPSLNYMQYNMLNGGKNNSEIESDIRCTWEINKIKKEVKDFNFNKN